MRDARRATFDPSRDEETGYGQPDFGQRDYGRRDLAGRDVPARGYPGEDFSGRGPKNFRRSDDRIRDDVGERLTRDPSIDASDIEIDVRESIVVLSGSVRDRQQKRRAEDIVDSVTGVRDVRNEIRIAQLGDTGGVDRGDRGDQWRTAGVTGGAAGTMTGNTRGDLAPRSDRGRQTTVVGVFRDMTIADRAISELKQFGFTRDDISFVTKDRGMTAATEGGTTGAETKGATTGAILGGLGGGALGWLLGVGALAIPGVGPVVAAGALATTIAGAAAGVVAGGLVGALVGLGVPENEAKDYEKRIKEGGILVAVTCVTDDERDRAKDVFNRFEADKVDDYGGDKRELTGSRVGDGQRRESMSKR